jgi:two-component system, NarL family, response regulator DevR
MQADQSQSNGHRIKVFVCDDHPIVRDALAAVLTSSERLDVVGVVSSYEEAIDLLQREPVDVALLDIRLGGKSGLELARTIVENHRATRVLFLTAFASDEVIFEASRIGAADLMDKGADPESIIERVVDVAAGRTFLGDSRLVGVAKRLSERGVLGLLSLSSMDRRIMTLLAEGKTDKQIADQVYLSPQTVRNRISRILTALDKDNRTQLALLMANLDESAREVL